MTCSRCKMENDPVSQFCGHCGAPLGPGAPPAGARPGPGMPPPAGPPTHGLAIVSLVCGILGLICILPVIGGIIGLICGIIALGKIKAGNGEWGGNGLAIGGIITSSIGLLFSVLILPAILFPVFSQARVSAKRTLCLSNEKKLGLGLMMYIQDYDEVSPPAARWADVIRPYTKDTTMLYCPTKSTTTPGYALNRWVDRTSLSKVPSPATVPTLFDAQTSFMNAIGGQEIIDRRHLGGYNMAYLDGHAKWLSPSRPMFQADTWNPGQPVF